MAIKRTDLEETDEQRETREKDETAAADARAERNKELESQAVEERVKRERAEAALDEARRSSAAAASAAAQPQNPSMSESQWQELERQNPGKTRDEIFYEAQKIASIADARLRPVLDEAKAARESAAEAKRELASLKSRKGLDSVESDFYEKNPALRAHRSAVEEVLSTYPDRDSVDAATHQKRLALAQDVVKGRIKETMGKTSRRNEDVGSRRLEGGDSDETSDDNYSDFDPKGTGNEGAAHLMRKVHQSFGDEARFDDSVEVWKKSQDEEGRGVSISSKEDIIRAKEMFQGGRTKR